MKLSPCKCYGLYDCYDNNPFSVSQFLFYFFFQGMITDFVLMAKYKRTRLPNKGFSIVVHLDCDKLD
jgi:hypothetical protein